MNKETTKISFKALIIRGVIQFFFIGILFSIIDDEYVLKYFLKAKTILQVLLFALLGGLLYCFVTYKIREKLNKKNENESISDK